MSSSASASASATATATETVTAVAVEAPPAKRQRTDGSDASQCPPIDELLVSLDVAACGWEPEAEAAEIQSTVDALARSAAASAAATSSEIEEDGREGGDEGEEGTVASVREALGLAVLVAFRRRNHATSLAPGTGAGEREMLRAVLRAIARHDASMVRCVLPLVPVYGSWRDLRVLAEQIVVAERSVPEAEAEAEGERPLPPLVDEICALFAAQLKENKENLKSAEDGYDDGDDNDDDSEKKPKGGKEGKGGSGKKPKGEKESKDGSEKNPKEGKEGKSGVPPPRPPLPSSAAKYAPHEGRHPGKNERSVMLRSVNKRLADSIAQKLDLTKSSEKSSIRAAYRRLRSALNRRLAEAGHLLEPLMAARRLDLINFRAAPKVALAKVRGAILRDRAAAARWRRAMDRSDRAVPEIADLVQAAFEAFDDEQSDLPMMPQRIRKAVKQVRDQRVELVLRAEELLEQVAPAGQTADASATSDASADDEKAAVATAVSASALDSTSPHGKAAMALRRGTKVPTLPVVLRPRGADADGDGGWGWGGSGNGGFTGPGDALLLAAFIIARAQDLPAVAVDGALVPLWEPGARSPPNREGTTRGEAEEAATAEPDFRNFCERAALETLPATSTEGSPARQLDDLIEGGSRMLELKAVSDAGGGDVLALCVEFACSADPKALEKATETLRGRGMWLLMAHRLREYDSVGEARRGAVPFVPRSDLRPRADRGRETIDVCFMLDLTGSMSAWISACKAHVASIINSLLAELGVGRMRLAFVGYRDWGERLTPHLPRRVVQDFLPHDRAAEVAALIGRQEADGGADMAEDVLTGAEAVRDLDWRGDVRICVLLADAPAHGYCNYRGPYASDDFPNGLCPDQHDPLPTVVKQIADETGVDLLVCKLDHETDSMEREAFAPCYPHGGYGVIPMDRGAHKFKDAILGVLSEALLGLIAPNSKTAGVQTFDATTLSGLISTFNASLRESIDATAWLLRESAEEAAAKAEEMPPKEEENEEMAAATMEVEILEAEVAAAEAALDGGADAGAETGITEKADPSGEAAAEEAVASVKSALDTARAELGEARTKAREDSAEAAAGDCPPEVDSKLRSDYVRLRASLEAEELQPIRLAIGLPVPTEDLQTAAAASLLCAGVRVSDMEEKGYPEPFIAAMRRAVANELGSL